jgi:hypothetical protein
VFAGCLWFEVAARPNLWLEVKATEARVAWLVGVLPAGA